MRESFVFRYSFYKEMVGLNNNEVYYLFYAITAYGLEENLYPARKLKKNLKDIFYKKIKPILDEDITPRGSKKYKVWMQEVFERDGHKCQQCGQAEDLHAHHIKSYWKYPKLRVDVNNGITLCKNCHSSLHKGEAVL